MRALAGLVAAALVGRLYGPAVLGAFSVALLVVACLTPLAALGTDLLSLDAAARSRPGRDAGDADMTALAVLAAISKNWGFLLLEGVWAIVTAVSLLKLRAKARARTP